MSDPSTNLTNTEKDREDARLMEILDNETKNMITSVDKMPFKFRLYVNGGFPQCRILSAKIRQAIERTGIQVKGRTPFPQIDPSPGRRARNQALGVMKEHLERELGMGINVDGLSGTLRMGSGENEKILARIIEPSCKWTWSEKSIRSFKPDFNLTDFLMTVPGNA